MTANQVGVISLIVTIALVIVGAALHVGQDQQKLSDLTRRVEQLEKVESFLHGNTANFVR